MKITFLGTSHGVPERFRKCSCTMIQVADRVYFIDMGCMAMDLLIDRGIAPRDTKAIFITHVHGDHTAGLLDFLDLASWYFKDCDPTVFLPKMETVEPMRQLLSMNDAPLRDEISFSGVKEGTLYDDGFLKVTAFPTLHCKPSFAYLVEAEGKRVFFTGDLKKPGVDFPVSVLEAPLDAVICEAAHFPVTEYIPVFENRSVGSVYVNHCNPIRMVDFQQVKDRLAPVPVCAVVDDQEIFL